jgi:hypothetical protein
MTITFKNCEVRADLATGFTETIFPDGSRVPAYPNGSPEQRETARRAGYGDDVAAMCREHEILHTWLAEKFNFPHSPTLWAVAHAQAEGCAAVWAQYEEEALVMAFQEYLNGGAATPPLKSLSDWGMSLEQLRADAIEMLRPRRAAAA